MKYWIFRFLFKKEIEKLKKDTKRFYEYSEKCKKDKVFDKNYIYTAGKASQIKGKLLSETLEKLGVR